MNINLPNFLSRKTEQPKIHIQEGLGGPKNWFAESVNNVKNHFSNVFRGTKTLPQESPLITEAREAVISPLTTSQLFKDIFEEERIQSPRPSIQTNPDTLNQLEEPVVIEAAQETVSPDTDFGIIEAADKPVEKQVFDELIEEQNNNITEILTVNNLVAEPASHEDLNELFNLEEPQSLVLNNLVPEDNLVVEPTSDIHNTNNNVVLLNTLAQIERIEPIKQPLGAAKMKTYTTNLQEYDTLDIRPRRSKQLPPLYKQDAFKIKTWQNLFNSGAKKIGTTIGRSYDWFMDNVAYVPNRPAKNKITPEQIQARAKWLESKQAELDQHLKMRAAEIELERRSPKIANKSITPAVNQSSESVVIQQLTEINKPQNLDNNPKVLLDNFIAINPGIDTNVARVILSKLEKNKGVKFFYDNEIFAKRREITEQNLKVFMQALVSSSTKDKFLKFQDVSLTDIEWNNLVDSIYAKWRFLKRESKETVRVNLEAIFGLPLKQRLEVLKTFGITISNEVIENSNVRVMPQRPVESRRISYADRNKAA